MARVFEVFWIFLRLGLTSFGGPVAHFGYFRTEFVTRLAWLTDADYADIMALCQFLPGPTSSQVGIAIGTQRAGYAGGIAAFVGFTAPSAVLMLALALGITRVDLGAWAGALHGLKLAALAVVAQAVWAMARALTPDRPRRVVAVLAATTMLLVPASITQLGVLLLAVLWGAGNVPAGGGIAVAPASGQPRTALTFIAVFAALLVILPVVARFDPTLALVDKFYRSGSLVFGGGHVVLPLLQAELVAPGWIGPDTFLAGYGAAQAVPGPLFSFAAFAGAAQTVAPNGIGGGLIALLAVYIPAILLVFGTLPLWQRWRTLPRLRAGLDGANAAVVGLLFAALYDPVFTSAVTGPRDLALALAGLGLLTLARTPPWLVVGLLGLAGWLLSPWL